MSDLWLQKMCWIPGFYHVDEGDKSFDLSSRGLTRSWARIQEEMEKCVLVCANCHREIHAGLIELPKSNPDDIMTLVNK